MDLQDGRTLEEGITAATFRLYIINTSLGLKEGTCFVGVCSTHGRVRKYTQDIGPEICTVVLLGGPLT